MKIKLYTLQGDHFSNPGHVMQHFTDKDVATTEAVALVNIMLADTDWEQVATAENWEAEVLRLQDYHGAQYCDVWVDETEIEVPVELTTVKSTKFAVAIDDDTGIQLLSFDHESARDEHIWNLAFEHDSSEGIEGVQTIQQYMEHYDDYDDAMQAAGIGYVTEEF